MNSHYLRRGLLLACLISVFAQTASAAEERMNVLFIMADDLRPELATYGSPAVTPNLDRLMQRSLQFNRAYCQQAVCNPSRSSMLTGLRPDTLHLWNNGTHFRERQPDVMTLPLWFRENGYETRCCGKIFHNWHTKDKGDARSWSRPEFLHYANHGDDKPVSDGPLGENFASAPRCECYHVADDAYYDGRVAREAVKTLTEIKNQPFFLAVGFWKPHAPFNAPKKYWDLYDRDKLSLFDPNRPAGAPELAFHDGRELRGLPPNQITFTQEQAMEIRHGYLAGVSYMDAQLGRVLDALDQHQLSERTVIVFAGDHGYHLGEHSLWAKTSNFELDARVPLAISVPGMSSRGQTTNSLAELLDLFPTLVDLCKLPARSELEGKSLAPVLKNPATTVHRAVYTQHPRPAYFDREPSRQPKAMGVSVRTDSVRYTEWRDWTSGEVVATELYDHRTDATEMKNVADQPELAELQRESAELLRQQFPITPHPAEVQ